MTFVGFHVNMEKDLEKYYDNRFAMMASEGWKQLTEDIEIMRLTYADIVTISSNEELQYRKGQLDIIDWILSLKSISEATYEEIKQDG